MPTSKDIDGSSGAFITWPMVDGAIEEIGGLPVLVIQLDKNNSPVGTGWLCETKEDVRNYVPDRVKNGTSKKFRMIAQTAKEERPEIDWFAINEEFGKQ